MGSAGLRRPKPVTNTRGYPVRCGGSLHLRVLRSEVHGDGEGHGGPRGGAEGCSALPDRVSPACGSRSPPTRPVVSSSTGRPRGCWSPTRYPTWPRCRSDAVQPVVPWTLRLLGTHVLVAGATGAGKVTERIYRKQLRPVTQTGATAMDTLFDDELLKGSERCFGYSVATQRWFRHVRQRRTPAVFLRLCRSARVFFEWAILGSNQ